MKKVLAIMSVLTVFGILIIPSGIAFADQAYHTERLPIHSVNLSNYPLKHGFMINIHMDGPNNYEKKEFQLNGAKPNTEFFIYRVFGATIYNPLDPTKVLIPKGLRRDSGVSITTDENGNGHCQYKLAPEDLALVRGVPNLVITVVLYEVKPTSPLPSVPDDGIRAYETEEFIGNLDWKW